MPTLTTTATHVRGSCFSLYGHFHEETPVHMLPLTESQAEMPAVQLSSRHIGSAFAWNNEGVLVTCAHVVEGLRGFVAVDSHGHPFAACLVAVCEESDIAILKIDSKTLGVVPADYQVAQGNDVFTIGHPLVDELGFSLARGVIAAIDRYLHDAPPMPHLQLDITIHPGNSGGPLFNQNGELVGMVRGVLMTDEAPHQQVPLAASLAVLKTLVPRLLERGHSHDVPDLGVSLSKLRPALAKALDVPPFFGLLVDEIEQGSLADKAGLQVGDIIKCINGVAAEGLAQLRWGLFSNIGKPLSISVMRHPPCLITLSIPGNLKTPATPKLRRRRPLLGARLHSRPQGVYVGLVLPGSDAAIAGLVGGETLCSYIDPTTRNCVPLESATAFHALRRTFAGRAVAFLIQDTNGTVRMVGLPL